MAFVVTCPSCKARLKTSEVVPAGTLVDCPRCETQFKLKEDSPELLEKKSPPLKSPTNAKTKSDRTPGADAGTPIKPKLKKNRSEDENEDVPTRSQKEQVPDDAAKDKDSQKRRSRRQDADEDSDETEERSPRTRPKSRKNKKNPLYLVLAISIPLLILIAGGLGYGFYSYLRSSISGEQSDDKLLSASIPLKREVKAGSSVGTEEVTIERTDGPDEGMHFNVKMKNGRPPSEELSLVITTDGGTFLEASFLEMIGKPEIKVTLDKVALSGKTVQIWVGRPIGGSLSKFTRISNIVQIAGN